MEYSEAIRLSEVIGCGRQGISFLEGVFTSYYILVFKGGKRELKAVLSMLNPIHAIYWRSNQVNHLDFQKVIIEDMATATTARMFGEGHEVRLLTIGELAQARNEIEIPWLPTIVGYIQDRQHNNFLSDILSNLQQAEWRARDMKQDALVEAVKACGDIARSLVRPTI